MTKKQFLWLLAAVAVFALTGYFGVKTAADARERTAGLMENAASELTSMVEGGQDAALTFPAGSFLARVDVDGTIAASGSALTASGGYDHDFTLDYIDQLTACANNVGILLYIDSPGGALSESDELYLKLMDYKAATGRPVYCYFDSYACSGGYYVAMASDWIQASRNSLCVNIGVYISTYNFSGLFEKYGVEQVVFKSSENKGIGLTGIPWTDEQKAIYQSIVDENYDQFLSVVAEGRHMTKEQVKAGNDGREMTAAQALKAGFIDGVGRYEEYEDQVLGYFDEGTELYTAPARENVLQSLLGSLSSAFPRSDSQVWNEFADAHSGIVVMAYDDNGL